MHLTLIVKHIRNTYNNGFRFIIGYEGNLFHETSKVEMKITDKVLEMFQYFNETIENMVGVRNAIQFIDIDKVVNEYEDEFYELLEHREVELLQNYEKGDRKLEKVALYYLNNLIYVFFYSVNSFLISDQNLAFLILQFTFYYSRIWPYS